MIPTTIAARVTCVFRWRTLRYLVKMSSYYDDRDEKEDSAGNTDLTQY
jgi:hypothetical protein